ncbi:hypothetical protein AM469_006123, partial [Pseudomonas aeruginosa]
PQRPPLRPQAGPLHRSTAAIVQRETRRQVYDPNLDQVMWSSHGEYQHNRSRSRGAAQAGVADTEENNESGG